MAKSFQHKAAPETVSSLSLKINTFTWKYITLSIQLYVHAYFVYIYLHMYLINIYINRSLHITEVLQLEVRAVSASQLLEEVIYVYTYTHTYTSMHHLPLFSLHKPPWIPLCFMSLSNREQAFPSYWSWTDQREMQT